jgi:hypothetical protein
VKYALIPIADILFAALRQTPGVKIVSPLKVPPGSQGTKLGLTLTRSAGETVIDVAPTDGREVVRMRLPDGTLVTKENAKEKGIAWDATASPPEDAGGDDFGFAAMILTAMMLPVEGQHQLISFEQGLPQSGRYTIEVDARLSDRAALPDSLHQGQNRSQAHT